MIAAIATILIAGIVLGAIAYCVLIGVCRAINEAQEIDDYDNLNKP